MPCVLCMEICISLYCCVLCQPIDWPDKCHMKKCFFHRINVVSCMTYYKTPEVLAGLNKHGLLISESAWLPDCSPLSCFYSILLFFAWGAASFLVRYFVVVVQHVSFEILLLLLWMGLFAYVCGLVLMCSRTASSGSVCLFVCFVNWYHM